MARRRTPSQYRPYQSRMSPDTEALMLMNLGLPRASTTRARSSFINRHKASVIPTTFVGTAVLTNRIDLMPFKPMGAKVPNSAVAAGTALLGAIIAARYFKRRDWALVLATASAGFGTGMLLKKIAERSST